MIANLFTTRAIAFALILLFASSSRLFSQNNNTELKVFIDCDFCNEEHIKQNISYVSFVHDPYDADIHILATDQPTAGNGQEFKLNFIPKKSEDFKDFTLKFYSIPSSTDDEIRDKTLRAIKHGLMPFLYKTGEQVDFEISYQGENRNTETEKQLDPWNNWVFNIGTGGSLEAEESEKQFEVGIGIGANRVSEIWKISMGLSYELDYRMATDDDEEITSTNQDKEAGLEVIKSINNHWSWGFFGGLESSSYENMRLSLGLFPAIEYNFYPWDMSAGKRLSLAYGIGYVRQDYFDETIYNKMYDNLPQQRMVLRAEFVQKWGEFDVELESRNYLNDFKKYSLLLEAGISLRIAKGLSFEFDIEAQSVHDQIYLPKGDASLEDILIRRRKQATAYEAVIEIGLSYTFGSIYNNVVNERL